MFDFLNKFKKPDQKGNSTAETRKQAFERKMKKLKGTSEELDDKINLLEQTMRELKPE